MERVNFFPFAKCVDLMNLDRFFIFHKHHLQTIYALKANSKGCSYSIETLYSYIILKKKSNLNDCSISLNFKHYTNFYYPIN